MNNDELRTIFRKGGTITLVAQNKGKFRVPIVTVTSKNIDFLNSLQTTTGGKIKKHPKQEDHHSQSWIWEISYDTALEFIQRIQPLLDRPSHRHRAEILLTQYKAVTLRNGRYNPSQLARKLKFEQDFFAYSDPDDWGL